ncbi:hypothetical protein PsorP6_016278 [Peronosclerospora sorghi]|uniref:Uncharacterized protein n=1 Tax=Peronosclerospora sorghi TaxID=230839 RepID=A0ACC0VPN6_9STRA|nr:hypothetical protein PsorP6_016278 [Peronosclerospora sorghi]
MDHLVCFVDFCANLQGNRTSRGNGKGRMGWGSEKKKFESNCFECNQGLTRKHNASSHMSRESTDFTKCREPATAITIPVNNGQRLKAVGVESVRFIDHNGAQFMLIDDRNLSVNFF